MEDYSFMKTGSGSATNNPELFSGPSREDLQQILGLFVSNALITASKYTGLCQRNTITKEDIHMGVKFEVLKFFENNNLAADMEEIKRDYNALKDEKPIGYKIEYYDNIAGVMDMTEQIFETEEEAEIYIDKHLSGYNDITLIEVTESEQKMEELISSESDQDPFFRISEDIYGTLENDNREFVDKIHEHNDNWDDWKPYIPIQSLLKSVVDKTPF